MQVFFFFFFPFLSYPGHKGLYKQNKALRHVLKQFLYLQFKSSIMENEEFFHSWN